MKVGIVGLGLIGGSLGLDLHRQGVEVVGVSRRQNTCNIALQKGAVNAASVHLSILQNSDLVIICTPIEAIANTLQTIIPYLDSQTIVTDVGSVKTPIVQKCSSLWPNFVGGHPMAGTEQQGIEAAQANLFQNAAYVLTPMDSTPVQAIEQVEKIAAGVGSKIYICSPEIHDRAVAFISHLPVMISAELIITCLGAKDEKVLTLAKNLASSGFRDTSRVGAGNVELGLMMAKYNRQELLSCLQEYRHNLDNIIKQIEDENWQQLEQILKVSQKCRPDFLTN
jgi:arogenate dehydrogenase (NADP+)